MFTDIGVKEGSEIKHLIDSKTSDTDTKSTDHYEWNSRTHFFWSKTVIQIEPLTCCSRS